jgi:LysM repeat protein
MKKIAILICLIGCVSLASAKETTYVKYESNSCIQQYYYQAVTNSGNGIVGEYYDFHVNIKEAEQTVVRTKKVGTYKKADYSLSKILVDCFNKKASTFQALVGKIATGEKEIFFIEEQGNNYLIYKGLSASYEMYNSKYFYSHSPDYSFKYIYNQNYSPSETIKRDSESGVTTMFVGKDTKNCNRQFGIVQVPEQISSPKISKEFLKNIGLYTEKNGDGLFILKRIDNMLLNDYLTWHCSNSATDLTPTNRSTAYDNLAGNTAKGGQTNSSQVIASYNRKNGNTAKGGTIIPTQYSQTTTRNTDNFIIATYKGTATKQATQKPEPKIIPTGYNATGIGTKGSSVQPLKGRHFVVKGDTLYSLSKKHGVSVDELKSWNNLSDNTIAIGDTIVVNKSAFVF